MKEYCESSTASLVVPSHCGMSIMTLSEVPYVRKEGQKNYQMAAHCDVLLIHSYDAV